MDFPRSLRCAIFFLCSTALPSTRAAVDPCSADVYKFINMFEGRRSSDWETLDWDYFMICDSSLSAGNDNWSRFDHQAGVRLKESCVGIYRCGTQSPIWMNGSHPAGYDVVERQVCANYGYQNGSCCEWTSNILVQKCPGVNGSADFFVYRLINPPGCHVAYCVDGATHKDCSPGYLWSAENIYCYENGTHPTSRTQPPTTHLPPTTPRPPATTTTGLPGVSTISTTSATSTTSTTTSTPPSPDAWESWSQWSQCSKTCDFGKQSRTRVCRELPCSGQGSEMRVCAKNSCPEKPDEISHGLTVIFESEWRNSSDDAMLRVIANENLIREIWRNETNAMCFYSLSACCGKGTSYRPLVRTAFVKPEDIWTAAGYPKPSKTYQVKFKFIAVFDKLTASDVCDGRSKRESKEAGDWTIYIDPLILEEAVKSTIKEVQDPTGLTIQGFLPAFSQPGEPHDDFPVWGIILSISFGLLFVFISLSALLIWKHYSSKRVVPKTPPPAYDDCAHVTPNDQLPTAVSAYGYHHNSGDEKRNDGVINRSTSRQTASQRVETGLHDEKNNCPTTVEV